MPDGKPTTPLVLTPLHIPIDILVVLVAVTAQWMHPLVLLTLEEPPLLQDPTPCHLGHPYLVIHRSRLKSKTQGADTILVLMLEMLESLLIHGITIMKGWTPIILLRK